MPTLIDEESGEQLQPLGFCDASPVLTSLLSALIGQAASSMGMYWVGYTTHMSIVIGCLKEEEGQKMSSAVLQRCERLFDPVSRGTIDTFGGINLILYLASLLKIGYYSFRFIKLVQAPQNGFGEHSLVECEEGINGERRYLIIAGVVLLIYSVLSGDTQAHFDGHGYVVMGEDVTETVERLSSTPLGLTGTAAVVACVMVAVMSVSISIFENVSGVNTAIDEVARIAEGFLERQRTQNGDVPAEEVMR
jgi:hypothetical protein